MTVYHQIQRSIDYTEKNLNIKTATDTQAASQAYMSIRNFHRLFSALTGFSFKQYVRKRILCESSYLLKNESQSILEIALEFGYESSDSYARAFRKGFNILPSDYRKNPTEIKLLHKINVLEDQYASIAVKNLKDMRVAYYRAISMSPEHEAWTVFSNWAKQNGLFDKPYRIFGYNNPNPQKEAYDYPDPIDGNISIKPKHYGYEYFMPVDESVVGDDMIKIKTIPGGKFAVYGISSSEGKFWIENGWKNMSEAIGKTQHQIKRCSEAPFFGRCGRWFEEHFNFYPDQNQMRLDLYLEIK